MLDTQLAQDEAALSYYRDGESDAQSGASPQSQDLAYLDGYLSALKALILQGTVSLEIRWLSPAYLTGGFDSPEPF